MRSMIRLFLVASVLLLSWSLAHADTARLKTGKEVRGIIVEDYKSRVVMSTIDGEQTIMKDDIAELYYDSEEENLVKLAERARERRDYVKAYDYYEKALKINPRSKAAQDGIVFCKGYLVRKQEVDKEQDVRRRADIERYGATGGIEAAGADEKELAPRLEETLGITIEIKEGIPAIDTVQQRSQAYRAGVRPGDHLIAVWSRLTGYMSLKEVMDILLEKPSLEMKVTIERTIDIPLQPRRMPLAGTSELIGAVLVMRFEGLMAGQVRADGPAAAAGLRSGDLITAIDGNRTRYMPLKAAIEAIKTSKGPSVRITFRRELIIWRARSDDRDRIAEV